MSYSAKFGSYLATNNDAILHNAEMVATTLTCNYETQVDIEIDCFDLDTVDLKVEDAATSTFGITTKISTKGDAG